MLIISMVLVRGNETDVEKELRMGQFGIISNNEEANEKLAQGVKISSTRCYWHC